MEHYKAVSYVNKKGNNVTPMFKTFKKDVLDRTGCVEHHTSLTVGYQKVGFDRAERYSGRFGNGWKVYSNNPNSTRFMYVTYYIEK